MRIEEIRLRNFRSYGNNTTVLALRPGLNVLLGRIGCGKTSILEAILVGLFGFSKAGIRKNDVLRKNATADTLQIELTFFFDRTHFKVARGNETRLESSPDGMSWTLISENSTEINKFLENTLEVTSRKFRDLFYAAQGELTNVITGSPEERQKSIDKLLGAEGLRETYEQLGGFTKHFDQDIGKAEGQLNDIDAYLKRSDLDEMRDRKREAEGEVIRIEGEVREASARIKTLEAELAELDARSRPLQEARLEIQGFQRENTEMETEARNLAYRIEQLKERSAALSEEGERSRRRLDELQPREKTLMGRIQEMETGCKRMVDLRTRARALSERREALSKELESLRELHEKEEGKSGEIRENIRLSEEKAAGIARRRSEREAEVEGLERELEQLRERLPEKEENLKSAELALAAVSERARQNAKKITDLRSLSEGQRCPFCDQPISESHRERVTNRLESRIRELLREEEAGKVSVTAAEGELGSHREMIENKNSGIRSAREEIAGLNQQTTREEQNVSNLTGFLEESRMRAEGYREELEKKVESLGELDGEAKAIRAESGAAGDNWPEELERLSREAEDRMDRVKSDLQGVQVDITAARRMLERSLEERKTIRGNLEENEKSLSRVRERIESAREEVCRKYEALLGRTEDPASRVAEVISGLEGEISGKKDELNARNLERAELSNQYRQRGEQITQLTERIEEYVSEMERKREVRSTYTVYSEARNILHQMRDRYKDAREMIRTNLINVLRELLRVEFTKLYTYEDFHDLKISDDYEVSLQSPVGEIQAHNLSAGQKAITAIAFRLAVAKAMEMKIGCWIIDEPTQNIGKAEVEALAEVLADTSKIPQILIATHHEALGRNGNVISLGVKNGESALGEGFQPAGPTGS